MNINSRISEVTNLLLTYASNVELFILTKFEFGDRLKLQIE